MSTRSIEYLAAAALKGAPLWKLMPRRSLSSQVVSSTSLGSDAASLGTKIEGSTRSRSMSRS